MPTQGVGKARLYRRCSTVAAPRTDLGLQTDTDTPSDQSVAAKGGARAIAGPAEDASRRQGTTRVSVGDDCDQ